MTLWKGESKFKVNDIVYCVRMSTVEKVVIREVHKKNNTIYYKTELAGHIIPETRFFNNPEDAANDYVEFVRELIFKSIKDL